MAHTAWLRLSSLLHAVLLYILTALIRSTIDNIYEFKRNNYETSNKHYQEDWQHHG